MIDMRDSSMVRHGATSWESTGSFLIALRILLDDRWQLDNLMYKAIENSDGFNILKQLHCLVIAVSAYDMQLSLCSQLL